MGEMYPTGDGEGWGVALVVMAAIVAVIATVMMVPRSIPGGRPPPSPPPMVYLINIYFSAEIRRIFDIGGEMAIGMVSTVGVLVGVGMSW